MSKSKDTIKIARVILLAKGLLEPGEEHLNPEYTRALIELCSDVSGLDKQDTAKKLGIPAEKFTLVL
jgi:hypothetical protein